MKLFVGAVLLSVLMLAGMICAQDNKEDETSEASRKLWIEAVGQTLAEAHNLRLPENRAVAFAYGGVFLWEHDQKRARALFEGAAAELMAAQELAEARRRNDPNSELLRGGPTRSLILHNIASRDAELALELLARTRPPAVQAAIASLSEKSSKINDGWGATRGIEQNERAMEDAFYRLAAEQNPQAALRLLEESTKKGVNHQTIELLKKVAERDASAAAGLAKQVLSRLQSENYLRDEQPNYTAIQVSLNVVREHLQGGERKLKFDAGQIRSLAEKLIDAFLNEKRVAPYIGSGIQNIAEKLSPSHVLAIKKAITASQVDPASRPATEAAFQKLLQAETPVEIMLEEAGKFSTGHRRQIYQSASNRLFESGNHDAARAVITSNFEGVDREQAIGNFNRQLFYKLMNSGKYSDAEMLIDEFPDSEQVSFLVNLATTVFSANPKENHQQAAAYMARAFQIPGDRPENAQQMGMLMQVINGYTAIDPVEGIRVFEGLVPKINELTDASAVLGGFQGQQIVRDGEFILVQEDHLSRFGVNTSVLSVFARTEPERTLKLIDRFTRPELRVILKLQLASSRAGSVYSARSSGRFRSHTVITTFH